MGVSPKAIIHPSAVVDDGAVIGAGTRVWHFSHIMKGAVIGADCVIGQGCFVGNVTLGDRVRIQNHVSIYDGVTLGDGVFCGPSCVFTNVNTPRAEVNRKDEFVATEVAAGVSIGANATIVCGSNLESYAFVAAGSVVTRDVVAHALVQGVPARHVGWMCTCGERLPGELDPRAVGVHVTCVRCDRRFLIRNSRISELASDSAS